MRSATNTHHSLADGLPQGRLFGSGKAFVPFVKAEVFDRLVAAVQVFEAFSIADDPYGKHDFGAFDLAGQRRFWKIDTYDRAMVGHSSNPADPAVTVRILTIMLAHEY